MSRFATRVLATDIRLHGRRFVLIEFLAATVVSVVLAVTVAVAAVVRGTGVVGSLVAVVFFSGIVVNSVAVWRWVARDIYDADYGKASLLDIVVFALATLIPGALALALRER